MCANIGNPTIALIASNTYEANILSSQEASSLTIVCIAKDCTEKKLFASNVQKQRCCCRQTPPAASSLLMKLKLYSTKVL